MHVFYSILCLACGSTLLIYFIKIAYYLQFPCHRFLINIDKINGVITTKYFNVKREVKIHPNRVN